MVRQMQEPPSVPQAVRLIVGATALVVVLAGVLMWLVDHKEYPSVGKGMWWALQTVTTVGYGDVTPHRVPGRIVAAALMLEGIAFVAILVAAITSSFVAGIQREFALAEAHDDEEEEQRLDDRFDALNERLDRLEQLLTREGGQQQT
jgi:voltage-gated potassium channel